MKKFLLFLLGVAVGIGATIGYAKLSTKMNEDNGLELFDKPGKVMSFDAVKTFQTIDAHKALALEYDTDWGICKIGGLTVLVYTQSDNPYYDDQLIKASKGTCFKQIGVYRYDSKEGPKTVPAIALLKK